MSRERKRHSANPLEHVDARVLALRLAFRTMGPLAPARAARLAEKGLFVANGDFYATTVVERLGHAKDGMVRVGLSIYSTSEEVERVVEAVSELQ